MRSCLIHIFSFVSSTSCQPRRRGGADQKMLKHFPPRRWNRTTAPLSAYRFEACNPDHRISSGQLGRPAAGTAAAAAVHSVHRTAPPQPTVGSLSLPLHTAHTTHTETSRLRTQSQIGLQYSCEYLLKDVNCPPVYCTPHSNAREFS